MLRVLDKRINCASLNLELGHGSGIHHCRNNNGVQRLFRGDDCLFTDGVCLARGERPDRASCPNRLRSPRSDAWQPIALANIEVRALVRDAEKAASLEESGADLALGTFEDPQAIRAAVDGVDTLVLITLQIPTPQTRRARSWPQRRKRVSVRSCGFRQSLR